MYRPSRSVRGSPLFEQKENNFLPEYGELCYDCRCCRSISVEAAGLPTTRWRWGKLQSVALNASTAFARGQSSGGPARTGNRDGGEFSATVDPALRAPGRAAYARADSPTPGHGSDGRATSRTRSRPEMAPQVFGMAQFAPGNGAQPGSRSTCPPTAVFSRRWTSRMQVGRKCFRNGLKRLIPRPEMAAGRTGRSAGPRSGVSHPRWRSRMRVGWKCCCNSLKGLIPRPGMPGF